MTARTNNVPWSAPPIVGGVVPNDGHFAALSATGQFTSTVTTGTAPLVVSSTTLVPNLYAARALLADSATVNANLTGPITSVGNATAVASQTGTGTKFVMDTGPTLVSPNIGAATGTSLSVPSITTATLITASGDLNIFPATGNIRLAATAATEMIVQANSYEWAFANNGSNFGPNVFTISDNTGGAIRLAIDTSGNIALGQYFGAESVRINAVASATNHLVLAGSNGGNPTISTSGGNLAITPALVCASTITCLGGTTFLTTSSALTDGAGAGAGTITNAPTSGNPTKWIQINDNGTTRKIPTWT